MTRTDSRPLKVLYNFRARSLTKEFGGEREVVEDREIEFLRIQLFSIGKKRYFVTIINEQPLRRF